MRNDDPHKPLPKPEKPKTYRERLLSGDVKNSGRERFLSGEDGSNFYDAKKKKKPKIKSKSSKRSSEESLYAKARKKYLNENPNCEICGNSKNSSLHHKAGRSGKLIYDIEYFSNLCLASDYCDVIYPESNHNHSGGCHGWVEANKDLARELGWLVKPTEK